LQWPQPAYQTTETPPKDIGPVAHKRGQLLLLLGSENLQGESEKNETLYFAKC